MSMLSAQCDELRELALWLDDEFYDAEATKVREAADTIWELRDMVHKERAENAKLRKEHNHWHVEQVHAYGNWEDAHKRAIELEKQNAKLRELAVLNWEWAHSCCGNSCKMQTEGCGYGIDRECIYEREIWERMHELGIEVE